MFNLIKSNKGSDDLITGFDRDRNRRPITKTQKANINLELCSKMFLDLQNPKKSYS